MTAVPMTALHLALIPAELLIVQSVLLASAPSHEAFAFGSRVRRNTDQNPLKPHADLDIALRGEPLHPAAMFTLRDAFSESDLPFRVDVVMQCDLPAHWLNDIPWIQITLLIKNSSFGPPNSSIAVKSAPFAKN